jgi:hypothetical protein
MKRPVFVGLLWIITLVPFLWIAALWHFHSMHARGFEALRIGDPEERVVARMGEPAHLEVRGQGFPRFADRACQAPCTRRFWYATRLNLDIEAWSVELDESGRVVHTAHWVSP